MTKKLNIDIIARDKSKQALNQVQGNLDNTKKSILNVKNALIGLGVGIAVRSIINVGKEVENLQVRFKFLFGSVEEGTLAFDNLSKFASKVPFSLEEITAASGNLAVVAKDANDLNRILEITGNVAAVTGLDFTTAGSQIQRAFSGGIGAADIFREKGVRSLLGFKEGAKVSIDETVAAFEKAFSGDGRFANATDDLAKTLTGTTSMLQDELFNFQKNISEQLIGTLTDELGDLKKFLEANSEDIKEIANTIGTTLAEGILLLGAAVKTTADIFSFFNRPIYEVVNQLTGMDDVIKDLRINNPELAKTLDDLIYKFTPLEPIIRKVSVETGHLSHNFKQAKENIEEQTEIVDKNSEALSKNMELAKGMQQFAIRNSKIMKTINHAEIERQRELDEEVQRVLDNQIRKAKERVELEKRAQNEIVGLTDSALSDLAKLNKTAFRAYQAFQIGQAIINAHATASRVMAQYAGLFPLNIAMAGAAYAAGAARVAAIRSAPAPRISGGRVNAGEPYMVGEGGRPELFVPQSSGTIVPNNQLSSPNVNITINANDTEGFDELLVKRRSTIVNVINDALNSQGKEALV